MLYRVRDDRWRFFAEGIATARRDGKLLLVTLGASCCARVPESASGDGKKD
jgi:hypothetical protein